MNDLWALQNQIFTTGEFNYQFDSDSIRDAAYAALTTHLTNDGAASVTATPDGIDLQGTCLSKGVSLNPNDVQLAPDWYSGYIRSATNEKSVLRSYFSAATATLGHALHTQARTILESQFHGRQIE